MQSTVFRYRWCGFNVFDLNKDALQMLKPARYSLQTSTSWGTQYGEVRFIFRFFLVQPYALVHYKADWFFSKHEQLHHAWINALPLHMLFVSRLGYNPIDVKVDEIGARAHYFKKNHQTSSDFIVQMERLFDNLWKMSAKKAFICFVIGRSKIHGEIIENEKIIANAGVQSGFNYVTTLERVIKPGRKSFNLSHARIKEEYIVILQK
jgi:hypothetical protein